MAKLSVYEAFAPVDGASCFVISLTPLGMVGTMRMEGHPALVHTSAASDLGQMLVRVCLASGADLGNIVREHRFDHTVVVVAGAQRWRQSLASLRRLSELRLLRPPFGGGLERGACVTEGPGPH